MRVIKKLISLLVILATTANLMSCNSVVNRVDQYTRIDFMAFDTVGYITIFETEDHDAYVKRETFHIANIKTILERLENIFSRTREGSELYKLNHRTTNEVMISRQLATLMGVAKYMYDVSVNHFDISTGNLVELWDVKNREVPPTEEEIKENLKYANNMDYEIIEDVDPDNVLSDKIVFKGNINTHYDLGALAKGYAAENIKEILTGTMGVTSGMINFGGSVTIIGSKDKVPYKIGIKRPFKDGYILTEDVINRSIITSGTYERYFEYDGKIYHHIISNETGYPVDNGITSVTINCDNPIMGDFLSTAILIVGVDRGKILLEAIKKNYYDSELSAIVIDSDENIVRF